MSRQRNILDKRVQKEKKIKCTCQKLQGRHQKEWLEKKYSAFITQNKNHELPQDVHLAPSRISCKKYSAFGPRNTTSKNVLFGCN